MKRSIIIALALALALGTAAIAEVADTTEDVEITAPVEEAEAAPAEEEPTGEATSEAAEIESLSDALKAFHEARQAAHTEELKAELDEYVAAGKLTQEQADLILKYVQEWQTGKQDGQRGCKGQFGGKQRGQMPSNSQQPQMPGNGQQGQRPQMGGQQPNNGQFGSRMPDANSGATPQMPQMPGNNQFGGQMPGNHR